MLTWLDTYAGLACWIASLAVATLAACAVIALTWTRRGRRRGEMAALCAARHPIRTLCDATKDLRELVEQAEGVSRLAHAEILRDGTLAQRIRDVRSLPVAGLPTPRSIEAAYQAREAAAHLLVWLERLGVEPAEVRLRIQTIWKALHDADGGLERDIAALEGAPDGRRRR